VQLCNSYETLCQTAGFWNRLWGKDNAGAGFYIAVLPPAKENNEYLYHSKESDMLLPLQNRGIYLLQVQQAEELKTVKILY